MSSAERVRDAICTRPCTCSTLLLAQQTAIGFDQLMLILWVQIFSKSELSLAAIDGAVGNGTNWEK